MAVAARWIRTGREGQVLCDPRVGLWRPGGSYSARRLVPGVLPSARASGARAPANGCEQGYVVACLESEVDRFVPIDLNVLPSAEGLGSRPTWLSGLERGEGGYHCPVGLAPPRPLQPGGAPPLACTTRQKGVPLGACLDQGPGFYTSG